VIAHPSPDTLQAGLEGIRRSPRDDGVVALIVRRPSENEREVLTEATLDVVQGLVGDAWAVDEPDQLDRQVTLMNARAASLVAGDPERRALAGDQLYVDLDLSVDNLPPGTRLAVGQAVVEVSAKPHLGCRKFAARFGQDSLRFVNSPVGRALRLRGLNATVVAPGTVRVGDPVRKLPAQATTQARAGQTTGGQTTAG
jgi:MOSC domain-containing protein YiiM